MAVLRLRAMGHVARTPVATGLVDLCGAASLLRRYGVPCGRAGVHSTCEEASPQSGTIREKSDSGMPVVATEPDGPHAKIYRDIAAKVHGQLAGSGAGHAAPKIVIEA